jgi:hypothetical protein
MISPPVSALVRLEMEVRVNALIDSPAAALEFPQVDER